MMSGAEHKASEESNLWEAILRDSARHDVRVDSTVVVVGTASCFTWRSLTPLTITLPGMCDGQATVAVVSGPLPTRCGRLRLLTRARAVLHLLLSTTLMASTLPSLPAQHQRCGTC